MFYLLATKGNEQFGMYGDWGGLYPARRTRDLNKTSIGLALNSTHQVEN